MKKLLSAVALLFCMYAHAQNLNDVNYLISQSSNNPSDSLNVKYPDFCKISLYERGNDNIIKGIYFLNNNSGDLISIANANVIFINQSGIVNDNTLSKEKLIALFYRMEGLVHYLSFVKQNHSLSGIVNKEMIMDKFALNKSVSNDNNCELTKYIVSDIKFRSASSAQPIADASNQVISLPLFQKYLAYANTCSDKPQEQFAIELIANNNPVPKPTQQISASPTNTVDPKKVEAAFKDLTEKKDEFSGNSQFFDSRVNPNRLHGSGLYAFLSKKDGNYNLSMILYTQPSYNKQPSPVSDISIKVGDQLWNLDNVSDRMKGNGTNLAYLVVTTIDKTTNDKMYTVLKNMVTTRDGKLRFKNDFGNVDYTLSDNEISELSTVIKAWEALNGF